MGHTLVVVVNVGDMSGASSACPKSDVFSGVARHNFERRAGTSLIAENVCGPQMHQTGWGLSCAEKPNAFGTLKPNIEVFLSP